MVAVVHAAPGSATPQAVAAWLDALAPTYPGADVDAFRDVIGYMAARVGEAKASDGERLVDRALGVAGIVAALKLDPASIRAALLSVLPTAKSFDADEVATKYGGDVAGLVAGVERMESIRARSIGATPEERAAQSENLRKMLLAMVEDIRVVILKLAERLQALRWLVAGDAASGARSRARCSSSTRRSRTGSACGSSSGSSRTCRSARPSPTPTRRSPGCSTSAGSTGSATSRTSSRRSSASSRPRGIRADVSGARSTSSASGPRCAASSRASSRSTTSARCASSSTTSSSATRRSASSTTCGRRCPGEFDDYIAKPKANDYRSLHTAVIGPEGKPLEVQIRTREMHQHSEYGVAAHWRYKEGTAAPRDPKFEDRIAWLRQVLDWKDAIADTSEWLATFKQSLFTDTIYVLTPQGKVIDLPAGATPVDFAYAVHTNLGHRCRGAKVDGHMVPLNTPLRNGQRVEVLTVKDGGPSRDWLNADLGYVTSHRARAKVRQWFKAQVHDETVAQGRAFVERELARAGASTLNLDALAAKAGYDEPDDLFAAVARDEINLRQLQTAIKAVVAPRRRPKRPPATGW
jgi:GTP pyrophosphokinase